MNKYMKVKVREELGGEGEGDELGKSVVLG